jgi:hypothetical protein
MGSGPMFISNPLILILKYQGRKYVIVNLGLWEYVVKSEDTNITQWPFAT